MTNPFTNWLQSRKLSAALNQGNIQLAQELLEQKQRTGVRLSLLEKGFKDKLQFEQSSKQYEREVLVLRERISQNSQTFEQLNTNNQQLEQFINDVRNKLRQREQDIGFSQQQLESREQENKILREQLRQKEQEILSIQQQLLHKQHIDALGKQRNEVLNKNTKIEQLIEQKQQEFEISIDKRQADNSLTKLQEQLRHNQQEFGLIQQNLKVSKDKIIELNSQLKVNSFLIKPELKLIKLISDLFKLVEHDQNKIQCTGIDQAIFNNFESSLVKYLQDEFDKISPERLAMSLKTAFTDIDCLKNRQDPKYNCELTPYAYFIQYFLDNVYCVYLAWFLIYKSGLLPNKFNILDIAAGPGTVAYGIALLLESSSSFVEMPQMHLSYYSLEKQSSLQYRGLQFWRRHIEKQTATNAYFRFDTADIFDLNSNSKKLPQSFFDFIVISHCFFADKQQRDKSYKVYKKIFSENLSTNGYVLIIVQGTKLFRAYNIRQSELLSQEQNVIKKLVEELGLSLEWYKYITSTGKREFIQDFSRFATQNLPAQKFMSPLKRQYLGVNFDSHYKIDDYVILAKR